MTNTEISQRFSEEDLERKRFSDRWENANAVIIEYGNFCIKMIVTLNSTALLASVAALGNFTVSPEVGSKAAILQSVLPCAFFNWTISLTLILFAAFFTYVCHRWYPDLLSIWHKEMFPDLYKKISAREKWASKIYNWFVWMGIAFGVLALIMFLSGVWAIALSIT